MFGYIRISKAELEEKEFERFKAYYCGLCKAIGKYSHIARMGLSYDMTFLVVLLSAAVDKAEIEKTFRCTFRPFKKEKALFAEEITDYTAQMSILLAYKKLEDDMLDERSIRALLGRFMYLAPMRKIKHDGGKISELLKKMSELEKSDCDEPDEIADCFAKICEILFTPNFVTDSDTKQILAWMGYNIGRWIYLLDAYDDLQKDIKSGVYNPFKKRYEKENFADELEKTLTCGLANIAAAYDLLNVKKNDKIIKNILYAGMGGMQNKILKLREEDDESLRGSGCKSE